MKANKGVFHVQADFCKAMAHPVRLEVIDLLKKRDMSVQEIAEEVGVTQVNLSQHLSVLRSRGVVRGVRDGNSVIYSLANRKIVEACTLIREILMEQAERQQAVVLAKK